MDFPILSLILFAPLAGPLLILTVPREDVKTIRRVGTAFAFLTLILAAFIWAGTVRKGAGTMQYVERYHWIPAFNIWYSLGWTASAGPWSFSPPC